MAFSPDGQILATGGVDAVVTLRDAVTGQPKDILKGSNGNILQTASSPDGHSMVTVSNDGVARLWDLSAGQLQRTFRGETPAYLLAISPDGRMLATGGEGIARLWDISTGMLIRTLPRHSNGLISLAFSPDGKIMATGGLWDGIARLWNVQSGQLSATFPTAGQILRLLFSPDGKTLASVSLGADLHSMLTLWDVQGRRITSTIQGKDDQDLRVFVFSPDSRLLATRNAGEHIIKLWDAGSGQPKGALGTNPSSSSRRLFEFRAPLAFSPDSSTLIAESGQGSDRAVEVWDIKSKRKKSILHYPEGGLLTVVFSSDRRQMAVESSSERADSGESIGYFRKLSLWTVRMWDVVTGDPINYNQATGLSNIPVALRMPESHSGASLSLHDPVDGRVLATMVPISEAEQQLSEARPIEVGAKAASPTGNDEWFVATPEGYFDCSANAARFIRWNVNGILYPAERYLRRFRRPDLVRQALRGERITAPILTSADIPPTVRFAGLQDGDPAPTGSMRVTVEAIGRRPVTDLDLLVNGRPLPPESARPIEIGAKPIEVGAKDPNHPSVQRFTFLVPLPQGAPEIRLRAVAYDNADLGSDPVEVVLRRTGVQPVPGNLYVLAVGVSRYRNATSEGFPELRFAAADARAIAQRFQQEGQPLYGRVVVHSMTDEQATAANVRQELQRLQRSVRPGGIDTVVVYLSGHGYSDARGRYSFAPYDFDLKRVPETGLSGTELKEALGGRLRAKTVFLFVDTCHAGGLGGRPDDLAIEMGEGVYLLASSTATENAYESEGWGHGAFTLALLQSLGKRELARGGVIYFNALTYAVPDEVADLLKAAGRSETEQEPCVPLASRRLRVPIAHVAP